MDDTLYPYRRYLLSAFAAVAGHVELWHGIPSSRTFEALARTSRGTEREADPLSCLRYLGLPAGRLSLLRRVIERHHPRLKLPQVTEHLLSELRNQGWRLGVLTNGPKVRQAKKVEALALAGLVDSVVFASNYGGGLGKPHPEPFLEIARRLDVEPGHVVFVGDDEFSDVLGALGAGMHAVRCDVWSRPAAGGRPVPTSAALAIDSFTLLRNLTARRSADFDSRHVA